MILQNFNSIQKIKKNNYNFDITEVDTRNPNNISESKLKVLSNSISINFTDNEREIIKECVKLMKKIFRLYIPLWKFLSESKELDNYFQSNFEYLSNENGSNLQEYYYSKMVILTKNYPYFYIKFKCLFNHYNNITKLPNGTYFYSGIKDTESYLELSPLCAEINIEEFQLNKYFGSKIYVPFTNKWFEDLITPLLDANELKEKIDAVVKLFSFIDSYTPKFLLYQKNIKKYTVPLKCRSSKNTILMYNLINYMSVDNFVKHSY